MSRPSRASRQREVTVPPRLGARSSALRRSVLSRSTLHLWDEDDVVMPSADVFTTPPPDTPEPAPNSSVHSTTVDTSRRRHGQDSTPVTLDDGPASTSARQSSTPGGSIGMGTATRTRTRTRTHTRTHTRTRQQAVDGPHVAAQAAEVPFSDATSLSDAAAQASQEHQTKVQKRRRSRNSEDDIPSPHHLVEVSADLPRKRSRTSTRAEHEGSVGEVHEDMFAQINSSSSNDLICNLGAAKARDLCVMSSSPSNTGTHLAFYRDFAVSSLKVQFSKGKPIKTPKASSLDPLSWHDATPRRFLDKNGTVLVVHLPGLLAVEAHVRATTALMALARSHPDLIEIGHAKNRKEYRSGNGLVAGQLALCKASRPEDPTDRLPVPSPSIASGPMRYRDMHELLRTLRFVSDPVDAALRTVDATQYMAYRDLNDRLESKCAYMLALNSVDPIVFSNRVIRFNQQGPVHVNKDIPPNSWVSLTAVGDFKQGSIYIPGLNLRLRLEPGDAVLFRGHALKYEVEDWKHGQRITIEDYTNQFLWDCVTLDCP
ncbi:hypothetical protein EV122DRAFT_227345 [Schizophyllum commune]